MKNLKKIFALALCLMMAAVMLTSCGGKLTGEWELDSVESDDADIAAGMAMIKAMGGSVELTFTKDEMTLRMSDFGNSESETMKYELDGNKIIYDDGSEMTYKISGKTLTLTESGVSMIFKRK